ncbi:MAG TPA: hypothetical protein VHG72_07210 [Polyangia bacterium]|nr:hypothetical protein [Polyangia bacterium]
MSHRALLWLVLLAAGSGLLAGCCGGSPSHKCDFTSPYSQDAGTDGPIPCATLGPCPMTQVCCLTKIAPWAQCIDPQQFTAKGCETKPPPAPSCTMPSDCDAGTVCCAEKLSGEVACQPAQICPGDWINTYIICTTDQDCPSQASGACAPVPGSADAGQSFSICTP